MVPTGPGPAQLCPGSQQMGKLRLGREQDENQDASSIAEHLLHAARCSPGHPWSQQDSWPVTAVTKGCRGERNPRRRIQGTLKDDRDPRAVLGTVADGTAVGEMVVGWRGAMEALLGTGMVTAWGTARGRVWCCRYRPVTGAQGGQRTAGDRV
jgi:hypothetical protein